MCDTIIWIILFLVLIIILGLYLSESTPLDLDEKKKILQLNYLTEHFHSESSSSAVNAGASQYYKWGLPEEKIAVAEKKKEVKKECHNKCTSTCPVLNCPKKCPVTTQCNICSSSGSGECKNCDITQNKDIDKYILKSSVPPCPNLNDYVTKNMIPSNNVNMSDYILKSEIKPCEKIDISNYILKKEIPACPTCPICPECPICPICPPEKKCKKINEYTISEHPDYSKYISKDEVAKKYISKDEIAKKYVNKDEISKKYVLKSDVDKKANEVKNKINQKVIDSEGNYNNAAEYKKQIDDVYKKQNNKFPLEQPDGYYAGDSLFAKA